jgi:hypothetical protein
MTDPVQPEPSAMPARLQDYRPFAFRPNAEIPPFEPVAAQPWTHDLVEAEKRARMLRETDGAYHVGLPLILDELDRLKGVEDAAALLLDACDAREAAGMTTGAREIRQFLQDVRRTGDE